MEKMGTGINRIKEECGEHGNINFEIDENWFTIIFERPKLEKASIETREKTREKIFTLIKENPKITIKELAKNLGITEKGVGWNISILKSKALLKRIGPDKGGYWEAVKEDE